MLRSKTKNLFSFVTVLLLFSEAEWSGLLGQKGSTYKDGAVDDLQYLRATHLRCFGVQAGDETNTHVRHQVVTSEQQRAYEVLNLGFSCTHTRTGPALHNKQS